MAISFKTNPAQANAQFREICEAMDELSKDSVTGGQVDAEIGIPTGRHAQNGVARTPWIMSTTEWLTGNPVRAMVWESNPSDVSWSMPQRSVHTKNLFGTVLHVWPDTSRNTFYDEFRLTFNLQSGNIMPVIIPEVTERVVRSPSVGGNNNNQSKAPFIQGKFEKSGGIVNFFDFMQLVDAPKLTTRKEINGVVQPPRTNMVSIQYNSNLFPKLTLLGMFDSNGIRFTDSSQNPNQVTSWSADFIVYDTVPRLTDNTSGNLSNTNMLALWAEERITKAKIPGKIK